MKVAYTSDIHSDITLDNSLLIPYLVKRVKEISPDVFVIAGDVSNSLDNLDKTLKKFNELKCHKIMIPGNHDIWIESNNSLRKGKDSFYKYRLAIPAVCKQNGFLYPITEPFIVDRTAIIGNIGWYDYSLRDCRLSNIYYLSHYEKGEFSEGVWNDTRYAIWLKAPDSDNWRDRRKKFSNRELFEIHFNELKHAIDQIPESIGKVLIILHTAPFRDCITPKDDPSPFDAYEGSVQIGDLVSNVSKSREVCVICGHRHKKLFLEIGNVKLYRSPVGYLDWSEIDYERIAIDTVGVFDM